ncbi:MAG: elongation factor Ts [Gammaproteobacteria bacterium]|jgi:elongation factor Ts|nr:elongation factor Ts [Gammaproteobacteria bacterium]MBK8993392.1 elongation factor Ts [Gammaproteobacteria bacterium]MBP6481667.1 elongation factor Ts [Pseudomonadales bacterium]MBP7911639.1 elongation factor Ts [Pseudomonadales bacterium]
MADITAGMVKDLRERTGLGMMECKKALVEANGDIELAIEELRKSSGMKAAKKAGRTAADGVVCVRVAEPGFGLVLEVNSETDFVARDANFLGFVNKVADQALAKRSDDVAALMGGALEAEREALVQKIGENITVRRARTLDVAAGVVGSYVHGNGKIAVLVGLKGGSAELARDVAMHVAALNPQYATPAEVPAAVVEKEREILVAQAADSGKPADIVAKMIEGRVRKFLSEISLSEQAFVKDPDTTVGKLLKQAGAELAGFVRFEVGEGIEKEVTDFAAEVAAQLKG